MSKKQDNKLTTHSENPNHLAYLTKIRVERDEFGHTNGHWLWQGDTRAVDGLPLHIWTNMAGEIRYDAIRYGWCYYRSPVPNDVQLVNTCGRSNCVNAWHFKYAEIPEGTDLLDKPFYNA